MCCIDVKMIKVIRLATSSICFDLDQKGLVKNEFTQESLFGELN
jgi:hypothetical protein